MRRLPDHGPGGAVRPRLRLALALVALCAAVLAMAGCGEVQDVNQRVLVYALGLDAAPGSELAVSVHFLSPHTAIGGGGGGGAGGAGGHGPGVTPVTQTTVAAALGGALDQLRTSLPGALYLGSLRVVLIGRDLAGRGLLPVLDHLSRTSRVPTIAWVVVVDGRAEDVLRSQAPGQLSPARGITSILGVDSTETLRVQPTRQWQVVNGAWVPTSTTILSLFELSPDGPAASGAAVLRGDRLVTTVGARRAGFLGAMTRSGTVQLDFPPPPGARSPVAMKFNGFSVRASAPSAADTVDVTIRGLAYVIDSPETEAGLEGVPELERYVRGQLASEVRELLAEMYRQRLDVLNLGEMVRERSPDGNLPQGWLDRLPELRFRVHAEVRLVHGERGL